MIFKYSIFVIFSFCHFSIDAIAQNTNRNESITNDTINQILDSIRILDNWYEQTIYKSGKYKICRIPNRTKNRFHLINDGYYETHFDKVQFENLAKNLIDKGIIGYKNCTRKQKIWIDDGINQSFEIVTDKEVYSFDNVSGCGIEFNKLYFQHIGKSLQEKQLYFIGLKGNSKPVKHIKSNLHPDDFALIGKLFLDEKIGNENDTNFIYEFKIDSILHQSDSFNLMTNESFHFISDSILPMGNSSKLIGLKFMTKNVHFEFNKNSKEFVAPYLIGSFDTKVSIYFWTFSSLPRSKFNLEINKIFKKDSANIDFRTFEKMSQYNESRMFEKE